LRDYQDKKTTGGLMNIKGLAVKALMAVLMLAFVSCSKNIREYRAGDENSTRRILIAMSGSDFKNAVSDGIVRKYAPDSSLKVITLNRLRDVSTADYDAIVLIDRALAWTMFNFAVKKFISNAAEKEKIVLYLTVDDPRWKAKVSGVDGITSASKTEDPQRIIDLLSAEIDRRLAKKNTGKPVAQ